MTAETPSRGRKQTATFKARASPAAIRWLFNLPASTNMNKMLTQQNRKTICATF